MNVLLDIGLLLILGYTVGWILGKLGLPKIVGYIIVGVSLSPNTVNFIGINSLEITKPLMDICLAFITFEVGGALKWSKIKKHENEIVSITLFASIFPFIFITIGVYSFGFLFPSLLPFGQIGNLSLSLILGVLASPTAPAATLAVMHQYKAKGKVTDTIMEVVALDDAVGIILFSAILSILSMFTGIEKAFETVYLNAVYRFSMALFLGFGLALLMNQLIKVLQINTEGKLIVIITSILIFSLGLTQLLHVDDLLTNMTLGFVIVNRSTQHIKIFKVVERYTEELIFLIFFLLSGLHLDISTIPQSIFLIFIFVGLRIAGKFIGSNIGARIAKSDDTIRKYTAGGLLPQAGIVIGLVLNISQNEAFHNISEILLTTIIGATILNEFIGPIITKITLSKAGELKNNNS